jgi:hypothetical protein
LEKLLWRFSLKFLKQFYPRQIRDHWFELALIALVMGVHIYAAFSAPHNFSTRWFTRDDAYYYFKVAQNISEGHGSTFDGINPTNGYHPLWMLVCVPIFALARFDLILPLRVLLVVMAALSVTTSILLFRLLKKATGEPIAMLAASFWAFNMEVHSVVTQQGMETGVVALSAVVFLYLLQKMEGKQLTSKDLVYLALAALFVIFSRLDGIFLVLIAGFWVIFRGSSIRYLLSIDLIATFSVVVSAYIQRAGLKFYLLGFDNSAILLTAVILVIQTVIFYFVGLYIRPKTLPPLRMLVMTLVGVSVTAIFAFGIMIPVSTFGILEIPRAVPILYWIGMLAFTLLTRFALRLASPWPVILSKATKPTQGILADNNRIRIALEPLSQWIHDSFVYFGIVGAGLAIYMGINRLLFGTFMPVSGQIKRWWGSQPNDVYGGGAKSFLDVFAIDPKNSQSWDMFTNTLFHWATKLSKQFGDFDSWYWSFIAIFVIGWLVLFLINPRKNLRRTFMIGLIPLLISAEFHALTYGAMAYSAKHEWYWVIQMLTLVILGAMGLVMLLDLLPRQKPVQVAAWALTGAASLYMAYSFSAELINRMPYKDPLEGQPYMDMLPTLEGYTEPGALIGMTGGGNAGYFIKDRTIVNMDGLINSYAYFQALKENRGGKYLANIGLDYIFANEYIITNSMPYSQQFSPSELFLVSDAPAYGQKVLMRFIPIK